jgi:hypothetical protein
MTWLLSHMDDPGIWNSVHLLCKSKRVSKVPFNAGHNAGLICFT